MCSIRGVVLRGKQSEDSWQKKVDYQEGLEKCHANSAAQSHDSYMKDPGKRVHEATKITWGIRKSSADSTAWSHESYQKELEKSHNDSAAWSHESYLKDP